MQAILTEEEYREYLELKANKGPTFEALRDEVIRQMKAAPGARFYAADPTAFYRWVCAIIQDIPNIAQQLRK